MKFLGDSRHGYSLSWLVTLDGGGCEQPWSLDARVGRKRHDADGLESCFAQDRAGLILREPEPQMAHLLAVDLAIVRQHVHEHEAAAGLEHARDFRNRSG